jgi:hypothetical protein
MALFFSYFPSKVCIPLLMKGTTEQPLGSLAVVPNTCCHGSDLISRYGFILSTMKHRKIELFYF